MNTAVTRVMTPAATETERAIANLGTPALELHEAAKTGGTAKVDLSPKVFARIDGNKTGLYAIVTRREYDPQTTKTVEWDAEEVIVPWVAFVSAQVKRVTIRDGKFQKKTESQFEVTVVTPDGRVIIVDELTAKQAYNPIEVLNAAAAGLPEPELLQMTLVKNMLRQLGHAQQKTRLSTDRGGWVNFEGSATFVEPLTSVDVRGLRSDIVFDIPTADRHAGAVSVDLPANVDEVIKAWYGVAPGRPDLQTALLALVAASCMRLERRTGVWLIAPPKVGKSLELKAFHPWFSRAMRGEAFSLNLAGRKSSPGGIGTRLARIGGIITGDDLRITDNNAAEKAEVIGQGVYQALDEAKQNPNGEDRLPTYGPTQACALITGEASLTGNAAEAIVGRMVTVELTAGDIDRTVGGGYDHWKKFMVQANAIRGAFVRWLAGKADLLGGLDEFTEWTTSKVQAHYEALADADGTVSREAEVVSVLMGGFALLAEFLAENGHTLEAPEGAWASLLGESTRRSQESNPAVGILDWVRGNIGRKGHFVAVEKNNGGQNAPKFAAMFGWKTNGMYPQPTGEQFGIIDEESGLAFIPMEVLVDASEKWDQSTRKLTAVQIRNGLGAHPDVLSGASERCPMEYARLFGWDINSRKRGAVVRADWLLNN